VDLNEDVDEGIMMTKFEKSESLTPEEKSLIGFSKWYFDFIIIWGLLVYALELTLDRNILIGYQMGCFFLLMAPLLRNLIRSKYKYQQKRYKDVWVLMIPCFIFFGLVIIESVL
jgi:dolichol kinase